MDGLLLVDKPIDWTSFDVVAKVRGVVAPVFRADGRKPKVGHTGTLDPKATGLLVLTLGTYCKRATEWSKLDKTYQAEITLGATSTTDDSEGEITENKVKLDSPPSQAEIEQVLKSFVGQQEQVPPQYSAIKVDGQRAYKQARQGKQIDLKPRPVVIHKLELESCDWPRLSLVAEVGSGTYIRSLARDLGESLGAGGYLSALRRTSVGPFFVSDAIKPGDLNTIKIQDHLLTA